MSGFEWPADPLLLLEELYQEAMELKIQDANAMALATVDSHGQPSVRVVLYKGIVRDGISFYTNYEGQKAKEIELNNKICVNFFWPKMEKQVRITGLAEKLTRAESEAYYKTRPRVSQIGAWASAQSSVIPSVEYLQNRYEEFEKKFFGQDVPCPPHWGGFLIKPIEIEFWIGRVGRLHERYIYKKAPNGWQHLMKSP